MFYTLKYEGRCGLWALQINNFRRRFYYTRDAAMKLVTRYRHMLETERWNSLTPLERVAEFERYDR